MNYDWEKRVTPAMMAQIDRILPDGINLVAVAVENAESCEAALITHPEVPASGLLMCDLWKDLSGDASRLYGVAFRGTFREGVE